MRLKTILAGVCAGALFGTCAFARTGKLSISDKKFLALAANADMIEAHLGQMAANTAAKTSVRDFGQTLVRDHTSAYEELAALAGKIGATVPKGIDAQRDRAIRDLMHAKGRAFDRQFLKDEVLDHERALAMFRREAAHGQDAGVKAYASKMIPTLKEHLHLAESLAKPERHAG
jgi:putative membrane protein